MRFRRLRRVIAEARRIGEAWSAADTGIYGAAVAYYTVFSLAPLLVIALSVVRLVIDAEPAKEQVIAQFTGTFGESAGALVRDLVVSSAPTDTSVWLAVGGFAAVLLGATAIFSTLESALDRIFASLPDKKERRGVLRVVVDKLVSLGMVLSLGFVLLASLMISAAIRAVSARVSGLVPAFGFAGTLAETAASLAIIGLFIGLMLKFLPSKRLPWRPALLGGMVASVGFLAGKYALALYLGSSAVTTAYGAASSVVLLILWAFYLSQVLFASAILTKLYLVDPRR